MKFIRLLLPILLLIAQANNQSCAAASTADEIQALKKQIEALTEKVLTLEKQVAAGKTQAVPAVPAAPALPADSRVEQLDQKVRDLERKAGREHEAAVEKARTAPRLIADSSGLKMSSADSNFVIGLRGILQVDSRTFFHDGGIKGNDGFLLRRVRPIMEGTVYRDFDFVFMPEFGSGASGGATVVPSIQDAYLNYRYAPALQLRVGKFKVPVGLEYLQSDPHTALNERAFPSELVPQRDLGVQLHGEAFDGIVSYAAGIFNGVGDNRNSNGSDFEDDKEFAGRVFLQPLKKSDVRAVKGLGLGLGSSYGSSSTANALPNGNGYMTDGQQQFFAYKNSVTAEGEHWRLSPQAYYYYGPFALMGEYVMSSQDARFTNSTTVRNFDNSGWQVTASWVLTGEDVTYKGVTPKNPFNVGLGHWGAWQLVARYEQLNLDRSIFSSAAALSYADPSVSAQSAAAWSVGLNWWLNKNVRVNANFSRTTFSGGGGPGATAPAIVTRQPENVFFTRVQLAF